MDTDEETHRNPSVYVNFNTKEIVLKPIPWHLCTVTSKENHITNLTTPLIAGRNINGIMKMP
jgi:hypothetical protein